MTEESINVEEAKSTKVPEHLRFVSHGKLDAALDLGKIGELRKTEPGSGHVRGRVERFERARLAERLSSDVRGRRLHRTAVEEKLGNVRSELDRMLAGRTRDEQQGVTQQKLAKRRAENAKLRDRVTTVAKEIDELNRQMYEPQAVHIEDPEIGEHDVRVTTLDLNPHKEGEVDGRVPYFVIPQYVAIAPQLEGLVLPLALQGEKVIVMDHVEKSEPDNVNWINMVAERGDLEPYVNLSVATINALRLDNINLVGVSMGGAIALKTAADERLAGRIHDVVVIDPTSLIEKSARGLGLAAAIDGATSIPNKGELVKTLFSSLGPTFFIKSQPGNQAVLMDVLSKNHITSDVLSKIKPKGKFQVWLGGKSSVTGHKAQQALIESEKKRQEMDPNASPMKIFVVEGAYHPKMYGSSGMAEYITKEKDPEGTVIPIKHLTETVADAIFTKKS